MTRNLFNEAKNGDIIRRGKDRTIAEIPINERNLSYYATEENRWDKNVSDLTFSPEVIAGENLPSATARGTIILDQNVKRFFDRKREDFGIFIKDLIENDVLPSFVKSKRAAHTFSFAGTGPDRDAIERRVFNARMVAIFQEHVKRSGRMPSAEEWRRAMLEERQKLSSSPTIDLRIPEAAYENLKYRLDVVITKENEDTDAKLAGRKEVLTALAANPSLATNPVTRPVFLDLANLLGVKNLSLPTEAEVMAGPAAATLAPGAAGARPPGGKPAASPSDVLAAVPA